MYGSHKGICHKQQFCSCYPFYLSGLIRARVTELVEPVLVLYPSLGSWVDLPSLASRFCKQQAAATTTSTHEMGKTHNSVAVLWIRLKFWWMIPLGVKNHRTNFEPKTQGWRRGTGVVSGGPRFQELQVRPQNSPKSPPRPSNSTICPRNAPKWHKKAKICAHWPLCAANQEQAIS